MTTICRRCAQAIDGPPAYDSAKFAVHPGPCPPQPIIPEGCGCAVCHPQLDFDQPAKLEDVSGGVAL